MKLKVYSSSMRSPDGRLYSVRYLLDPEELAGLQAAIEVEETLKWRLTAAQLRVDIWRTREASNRNQDRATR